MPENGVAGDFFFSMSESGESEKWPVEGGGGGVSDLVLGGERRRVVVVVPFIGDDDGGGGGGGSRVGVGGDEREK